jgi:hypothetical protein
MVYIYIDKKNYILADDIITACPIWCKGVRNGRELVKKKNIDKVHFIYARLTDEGWTPNEGISVKYDKVLIRKLYLDKCDEYKKEINNDNVRDEKGIEKAPDIIILDDEEKFKGDDGNILEIETRGVRDHKGIYFKVKEVETAFEMNKLHTILIDKSVKDGYTENEHYKYFNCEKSSSTGKKTDKKNTIKKELFLTYEGMIRLLYVSRSKNAKKFRTWATDTLFTAQMGTKEQKQELSSKLLGVSVNAVKEVFKTSATTIPCVYLFTLNTVKALRQTMSIDNKYTDNMIVCKYGFTADLPRRAGEHMKTYGSIKNADLKMKYHSYVDPMYISDAERDIRDFFTALGICFEYKTYNELVIIKPDLWKTVENQYKQISNAYAGHIKDMIKKVEDLENCIKTEKIQHALDVEKIQHVLDMETAKYKNELDNAKYKNELMQKEYENMILKKDNETLQKNKNNITLKKKEKI